MRYGLLTSLPHYVCLLHQAMQQYILNALNALDGRIAYSVLHTQSNTTANSLTTLKTKKNQTCVYPYISSLACVST